MTDACVTNSKIHPYNHVLFENQPFAERLLDHLKNFYLQRFLTDISLFAGSRKFSAHKIVLSSISEFFRDEFTSHNKHISISSLHLDVEENALEAILNFCYSGKIEISVNNVGAIQAAATKFKIEDLVRECNDFLEKNLERCKTSISTSISELDTFIMAEKKFVNKAIVEFMDIYSTTEFLSVNAETVVKIVRSDDLRVPSESYVFDAVRKWLLYDFESREKFVNLLDYVRFPLIPQEYLFNEVTKFGSTVKECYIKVIKATELKTVPLKKGETYPIITIPRNSTRKIFAVGSWQIESSNKIRMYDGWNDSWFAYAQMNINKVNYGIALYEEKIFIVGGWANGMCQNSVEVINLIDGKMTSLPPMAESRQYLGAVVVEENSSFYLYAIGGHDGLSSLKTVERYDFSTGHWTYAPAMLHSRDAFGITVLDNKIYVAGGRKNDKYLKEMEEFDPKINRWVSKTSMKNERGCNSLIEKGRCLYAVGGYKMNEILEPLSSIETYDPSTNTWSDFGQLRNSKGAVGAGFLGNTLMAVGGRSLNHSLSKDVDLYDADKKEWKSGYSLHEGADGVVVFPVPWKLINQKNMRLHKK